MLLSGDGVGVCNAADAGFGECWSSGTLQGQAGCRSTPHTSSFSACVLPASHEAGRLQTATPPPSTEQMQVVRGAAHTRH